MDKNILPPSKRKEILFEQAKIMAKKGYRSEKQTNFSIVFVKSSKEVSLNKKIKRLWANKLKKLSTSVTISVDMYGNIRIEEV